MSQYDATKLDCVPVINNNGNTAESLVNSLCDARQKIMDAMEVLRQSDICHGRNFQTCGNNVKHYEARKLMERRDDMLEEIANGLYAEAVAISNQKRQNRI